MLPKQEDLVFFARTSDKKAKSMLWATKEEPDKIQVKYKCVCGYIGKTSLPRKDIVVYVCEKCGEKIQYITYKVEKKRAKNKQ
ncbi:MAG: hypothetical protein COW47_01645 [Candidatus Huberarchaeum crystalense]|uniref:Uncharacterized protein n=1 Tax=Huberarchaeum crystalense TaxID=2014257 RepID=A0A2G9LIY6_HUBC1|nr:hypothetical protein [archaeon]OIP20269.1 MAG: hypothetical protein AUJ91_01720 [archaeon CG2_30_31_98]PIN66499.1 MAG: hypothetical protein COW69_01970 [Candidatus Huberarchaeum crystalense]NCS98367.1 hypothetical protein [archaeon]PIV13590.1 MAG: hypothetical protein COS45_02085 [Candidatus Huberarchaeum crystalense]